MPIAARNMKKGRNRISRIVPIVSVFLVIFLFLSFKSVLFSSVFFHISSMLVLHVC